MVKNIPTASFGVKTINDGVELITTDVSICVVVILQNASKALMCHVHPYQAIKEPNITIDTIFQEIDNPMSATLVFRFAHFKKYFAISNQVMVTGAMLDSEFSKSNIKQDLDTQAKQLQIPIVKEKLKVCSSVLCLEHVYNKVKQITNTIVIKDFIVQDDAISVVKVDDDLQITINTEPLPSISWISPYKVDCTFHLLSGTWIQDCKAMQTQIERADDPNHQVPVEFKEVQFTFGLNTLITHIMYSAIRCKYTIKQAFEWSLPEIYHVQSLSIESQQAYMTLVLQQLSEHSKEQQDFVELACQFEKYFPQAYKTKDMVAQYHSKCCSPSCNKHEQQQGQFKQCSRCKKVIYCSTDCQLMHWKSGHNVECTK
jgi:MYND finger